MIMWHLFSSQETRRDEQLVRRLTRQTQQEQRLATQLLQIRRQKEVILENRLFREEQYRQRRDRDLEEALEWQAVCKAAHARNNSNILSHFASNHVQTYKCSFPTLF